VSLGGRVGGGEGKDIRQDGVHLGEGVPPLEGRRRGIPVKLRNSAGSEAVEEVGVPLSFSRNKC